MALSFNSFELLFPTSSSWLAQPTTHSALVNHVPPSWHFRGGAGFFNAATFVKTFKTKFKVLPQTTPTASAWSGKGNNFDVMLQPMIFFNQSDLSIGGFQSSTVLYSAVAILLFVSLFCPCVKSIIYWQFTENFDACTNGVYQILSIYKCSGMRLGHHHCAW